MLHKCACYYIKSSLCYFVACTVALSEEKVTHPGLLVGRSFGGSSLALWYTRNVTGNSISVYPAVILKSLLPRYRHACIPAALRGRIFTAAHAAKAEAAPSYEHASDYMKREVLGVTELHETQSRDNVIIF